MPQKPIILFDGDCSFCRRWIDRWRFYARDQINFEPYQQAADRFPKIPREQLQRAIHLIEPDGAVSSGAGAVFRMLWLVEHCPWLYWLYDFLPGFAFLAEQFYRLVANHRDGFDKLDMLLIGKTTEPATYQYTCALFLRFLGAIYVIAFVSLWVQIDGLIGSSGILPIGNYLQGVHRILPKGQRFWQVPTLCWLNSSDGFLHFLCAGGVIMSVLLILGAAPILMLIGLWVFYVSLVIAGQDFLSFQWDSLLLEAGFASLFFAPAQIFMRLRTAREPSHIGLWLLRWLAFRIMFLSGITKLLWDENGAWHDWTALNYHYWTQPLPPWTAWYIHQLPQWLGKFSLGVMYAAELAIPFLIFAPRRPRRIAFWGIVIFQLSIALTGNYGFFNVLTMVLCIPLVDDTFWPRKLRRDPPSSAPRPAWLSCVFAPIAVLLIVITSVAFARECRWDFPFPEWTRSLYAAAYPFRSANGYGLFRTMTLVRHEIIIEGSNDGVTWKTYEFRYKPGDVNRRPQFCAPHMPRLDWQMWFQAIPNYPLENWFVRFLHNLLENAPPVTALLEHNPFPDHPPKFVRAKLFDYHFTTRAQRAATGAWWRRDEIGQFIPPVSLENFRRGADGVD
jgi:predicted DCC family thiol-disulfide oxidoreductase YuxK